MNYSPKKGKEINPLAPLGLQDVNIMLSTSSPKEKFLISLIASNDQPILDKEALFEKVGSLFICSRIIIAEELTSSETIYHVLMGLASPLQWKKCGC